MMRKIRLTGLPATDANSQPEKNAAQWHSHALTDANIRSPLTLHNPLALVIDDSPTVRKMVEMSLLHEGFQVQCFPDGIEALRSLTEPGACIPELIILDIGLPKMNGYDVARRLKSQSQFNKTIIIMLSRHDGVMDRLKGRLSGAQDYLTKPCKTQDIISIVEAHIRLHA